MKLEINTKVSSTEELKRIVEELEELENLGFIELTIDLDLTKEPQNTHDSEQYEVIGGHFDKDQLKFRISKLNEILNKKTVMKDFDEKLHELLERNRRNEIEPIEWSQENEELIEGKTIVTTKFKYKAPTPIKRKD